MYEQDMEEVSRKFLWPILRAGCPHRRPFDGPSDSKRGARHGGLCRSNHSTIIVPQQGAAIAVVPHRKFYSEVRYSPFRPQK